MCSFPVRGVCGSKILCKRPCARFPQTYAARYPVSECGSVVTVAGEMCIFPARGVCGSKILCKRACVRSAETIVNGSV